MKTSDTKVKIAIAIVTAATLLFVAYGIWGPPAIVVFSDDLDALRERGELRIVVRPEPISYIPRTDDPVIAGRTLARDVAESLGLEPVFIVETDIATMLQRLADDEADIASANLAVTKKRKQIVNFSVPFQTVDEWVVAPISAPTTNYTAPWPPPDFSALAAVTLCARQHTSHLEAIEQAQKAQAVSVPVEVIPAVAQAEGVLDRIGVDCGAAVIDGNYWDAVSHHFEDLMPTFKLTKNRPIALAVRKSAPKLKRAVDRYLVKTALTVGEDHSYRDDLPGLKSRRRIRMLTRNNALNYFIYRGRQLGYEYEMASQFAESLGLRLDVVVPPDHAQLLDWLNAGKGDFVAASMTPTQGRQEQAAFSQPYADVQEWVVGPLTDSVDWRTVTQITDLRNPSITVRGSSSFADTLAHLERQGARIDIDHVGDNIETETMLMRVARGDIELTVADSNLLFAHPEYGRRITGVMPVSDSTLAWAFRQDNPALLQAANQFFARQRGGLFFNMMQKRYFQPTRFSARAHSEHRPEVGGQLTPWDDIIREHAAAAGFDWRLIAAQIYHESKFKANSTSWAGAIGPMQLMPRTARAYGVTDPTDPEESIPAGIEFLKDMFDQIGDGVPLRERLAMTLAAYNVGQGHLRDARRIARWLKRDPNLWFDHTEQAMLKLSDPRYYQHTRFGYARGREPVEYVKKILATYRAYTQTKPDP